MDNTPTLTGPREGFALVLLGSMNPALHHPTWYQVVEALQPDEVDSALTREFIFAPQIAQFSTGVFEVFCDSQRWQVSTSDLKSLPRLINVASIVFDDRLRETPISAVGLNFHIHRETGNHDVAQTLSQLAQELPFGFVSTQESSAKFSFVTSTIVDAGPNEQLYWDVERSVRGKSLVYVSTRLSLELKPAPMPTPFSLKELVIGRVANLQQLMEEKMEIVIRALTKKVSI